LYKNGQKSRLHVALTPEPSPGTLPLDPAGGFALMRYSSRSMLAMVQRLKPLWQICPCFPTLWNPESVGRLSTWLQLLAHSERVSVHLFSHDSANYY